MPNAGQKKYCLALAVMSLTGWFLYLFLYYDGRVLPREVVNNGEPTHLIFNQPDEAVNYFFIRRLALAHEFGLPEPLSGISQSQVHPRSTTVVGERVVPIGFPGIIFIFGSLSKLAVQWLGAGWFNLTVVSLTPLAAAIMPWFLFGLSRRIFNDRVGFLTAALAFILPPWWYYASRPLQHNVLFVTLVVALLYCLIRLWEGRSAGLAKPWLSFGAGLTFALALYIRPVEFVWLSVLALVFVILGSELLTVKKIIAAAVPIALVAGLFFYTQNAYYGSPLASGYVKPLASGEAGSVFSGPQGISLAAALLAPFGVHPRAMAATAYHYLARLFLAWFLLAALGAMLLSAARDEARSQTRTINSWFAPDLLKLNWPRVRVYVVGLALLGFYLVIFYGSWQFTDNLAGVSSIGSSQVRYFLPVYVLGLPFVALTLSLLLSLGKSGKLMFAVAVAALGLISLRSVFVSFEGLLHIKSTVATYYEWRARVEELTEPDAIIVTRYADKYLFPARKIVAGWQSGEEMAAVRALVKSGWPLYWYDPKPDAETLNLLGERLRQMNLRLLAPIGSWGDLSLRRVVEETR